MLPILRDVRIGSHQEGGGWDRIVFEFSGAVPTGEVEYADQIVQCGSGERVFVRGSGALLVRFDGAWAHDDVGRPTLQRTELPGTGNVIVQARLICDFEGEVAWAVGVTARQPFAVVSLDNPSRVVI